MHCLTLVSFTSQALVSSLEPLASSTSGERGERRMALVFCVVMGLAAGLAATWI